MSARTYLPDFVQPSYRAVRRNMAGDIERRDIVVKSAPWCAMVALRFWATERAEMIADAFGPDIPADVFAWELAETIANAVLDDITAIDDAWSIGPWWERRHALILDARFPTTAPMFPAAPKVIAATERHQARKDGTIRSHRKRDAIAVGGSGKRTADGQPVPASMSAIAALLPETGGTARDAYSASIALQAQGLIPAMIGGEDTMSREMTPALAGTVRIESQRENAGTRIKPLPGRTRSLLHEDTCPLKVERSAARKGKRKVDSSIVCQCSPTYRITERVGTTERTADHRRASMVRGVSVLASESTEPWSRRHIGDAVVVLAPSGDVTRTTETRKLMGKGRKVTRYVGGKAKPNTPANAVVAPIRGNNAQRTNRADTRAEILELLATLPTEGSAATWAGWRITCEQEATPRASARYSAERDDMRHGCPTIADTPRGLATFLASLPTSAPVS